MGSGGQIKAKNTKCISLSIINPRCDSDNMIQIHVRVLNLSIIAHIIWLGPKNNDEAEWHKIGVTVRQ